MIKVELNKVIYDVPQLWSEVNCEQWIGIEDCKSDFELINLLTGIPIDLLPFTNYTQILNLLNFVSSPVDVSNFKLEDVFMGVKLPFDIKRYSWVQKIELENLIQKNEANYLPIICEAVAIYLHPVINKCDFNSDECKDFATVLSKKPFISVYLLFDNIFNQLVEINKRESETLSSKPTAEQQRAGISSFNMFGIINTVDALAEGKLWRYEDVLKMDYNTIYAKMLRNKTESVYQENYRKIMSKGK